MSNEMVHMPQGSGALVHTESNRAIAEVQASMILARQFPRNEQAALNRILKAFSRVELAEQGLYMYMRGGTEVAGPSVRAAEAIAQAWGNIQFGIRELSQGNGESTVEAYAWDIETNVKQVKVFQVPHIRYSSYGDKKLTDPREIYETVANNGARRLRACILGVIPADVIDAVERKTDETLRANVDLSPEGLKKLCDAFSVFGVTQLMIETKIQRKLESIAPIQVLTMRKIYNSLKDGISKPSDWFKDAKNIPYQAKSVAKVAQISEKAAAKTEPKPKVEAVAEKTTTEESPTLDAVQEVYVLLQKIFEQTGEASDDVIEDITGGKLQMAIELADKPAAYVHDIKITLEARLAELEKM